MNIDLFVQNVKHRVYDYTRGCEGGAVTPWQTGKEGTACANGSAGHVSMSEYFSLGFLTACALVELFLLLIGPGVDLLAWILGRIKGDHVFEPFPDACAFSPLDYTLHHPLPELRKDSISPNLEGICKAPSRQKKSQVRQTTGAGTARQRVRHVRRFHGEKRIQRHSGGSRSTHLPSRRSRFRSKRFFGPGARHKARHRRPKRKSPKQ